MRVSLVCMIEFNKAKDWDEGEKEEEGTSTWTFKEQKGSSCFWSCAYPFSSRLKAPSHPPCVCPSHPTRTLPHLISLVHAKNLRLSPSKRQSRTDWKPRRMSTVHEKRVHERSEFIIASDKADMTRASRGDSILREASELLHRETDEFKPFNGPVEWISLEGFDTISFRTRKSKSPKGVFWSGWTRSPPKDSASWILQNETKQRVSKLIWESRNRKNEHVPEDHHVPTRTSHVASIRSSSGDWLISV